MLEERLIRPKKAGSPIEDVIRLGVIMEPDPRLPQEMQGVLNPAVARGRDGHLYVFPRLVAKGNYSRIGIARVVFDETGTPRSVVRMGVALEPTEPSHYARMGEAAKMRGFRSSS